MFLDIGIKELQNRTVFEYIAATIEAKFPDSKDDANSIRNAKTQKEVKHIFDEYYEGFRYDKVEFPFDDIDNIVYWMDQEMVLFRKNIEHKKWLEWLMRRGLNPERLKKGS